MVPVIQVVSVHGVWARHKGVRIVIADHAMLRKLLVIKSVVRIVCRVLHHVHRVAISIVMLLVVVRIDMHLMVLLFHWQNQVVAMLPVVPTFNVTIVLDNWLVSECIWIERVTHNRSRVQDMLFSAHGVRSHLMVYKNVTMIAINNMFRVLNNVCWLLRHDSGNRLCVVFAIKVRVNEGIMHSWDLNIVSLLAMRTTLFFLMEILCMQLHFFNFVDKLFMNDRVGRFVHMDHLDDFLWLHLENKLALFSVGICCVEDR